MNDRFIQHRSLSEKLLLWNLGLIIFPVLPVENKYILLVIALDQQHCSRFVKITLRPAVLSPLTLLSNIYIQIIFSYVCKLSHPDESIFQQCYPSTSYLKGHFPQNQNIFPLDLVIWCNQDMISGFLSFSDVFHLCFKDHKPIAMKFRYI